MKYIYIYNQAGKSPKIQIWVVGFEGRVDDKYNLVKKK